MAPMLAWLIAPTCSSLIQLWLEKDKKMSFFLLLALASIIKAMSGKNVTRAGKAYNNMDNMTKYF